MRSQQSPVLRVSIKTVHPLSGLESDTVLTLEMISGYPSSCQEDLQLLNVTSGTKYNWSLQQSQWRHV